MNRIKIATVKAGTALLPFVPVVAMAQADLGYISGTANSVMDLIQNILIPLVFALALLLFLWGMFRFFIYGGHDEGEREKGKGLMIWAVIGFVLMVGIWGIVSLISSGLGLTDTTAPNLPEVPTS